MKGSKAYERAVRVVQDLGIALVYPIANRPEPPSLWSSLHPRTPMRWSWDEGADERVVDLWHLRAQLAEGRDVVYGKWFRGRATFFSVPVFHAMLGRICRAGDPLGGLSPEAAAVLDLLRERSPMSTKALRAEANLRGKAHERVWNDAMRSLWSRLLVVGTGEVEDGAFPSLAVGATELLHEDLWTSRHRVPAASFRALDSALDRSKAFAVEHGKGLEAVTTAGARPAPKTARRGVYRYDDL